MAITNRTSNDRHGGVTLEFILALPVFLIAMFAVFQFALFFAGSQQVALASRVGAEAASQTELPNSANSGMLPVSPGNQVPDQSGILGNLRSVR